jgi:hypothetical protein
MEMNGQECGCRRCLRERGANIMGLPIELMKMVVCPECGNKRCPKASDHRHECTDSNEPGQLGSVYP